MLFGFELVGQSFRPAAWLPPGVPGVRFKLRATCCARCFKGVICPLRRAGKVMKMGCRRSGS
jgi:hypothetical protein